MSLKILKIDPYLEPYKSDLELRVNNFKEKKAELTNENGSLLDFANGYKYFGFQKTDKGYIYREWAPAADKMYITGDFNGWNLFGNEMKNIGGGVFEIHLPNLEKGQYVQAVVVKGSQVLRRVPSYATRVVQNSETNLFCAQIDDTLEEFNWTDEKFSPKKSLFIYECHIGMSGEEYGINSYTAFKENILPRIKKLGYNTIQIMAIMEHPYYGSFGYQVSNFFAPSTKFGSSRELKELINTAHSMGIAVLLDVVHSHAVKNTNEGLNEFDGTDCQYFHTGEKGNHPAWGTKLFDYGKNQVLHFLLSNLKYWLEVFHFDGFRFDGVTSMLYHDHGLGSAFVNYDMYFSLNTDTDAVTYLCLANELVHKVNKKAITIAEDMSGMPGMCLPVAYGGIGFDFRLAMGVPDMWIKLLKDCRDEDWNLGYIWHELTSRREKEKAIGYAESHDQALVGDKTIMFRLCDAQMYTGMSKNSCNMVIDRGMALHKMIRFITASLGGEGYLNFMGNEFGHPEWIDFPREGNGWSYHYCRRQWSLADNDSLRYCQLETFDREMIKLLKKGNLIGKKSQLLQIHEEDKIISYLKGDKIFIFNFNPVKSFEAYCVKVAEKGKYKVILSTDQDSFGGFNRVDTKYVYDTFEKESQNNFIKIYLPSRTAVVMGKV